MNIGNFLIACFTLFSGVFVLAQNNDIFNAYPLFNHEGTKSQNAKPFSYLNLNSNQTNAYIRLYAFEVGGLIKLMKNYWQYFKTTQTKPF